MNPFYFDRSLKDYEKVELREQEEKIKKRKKEVRKIEEVANEKIKENNSIIKKKEEVEAKIEKELKDIDKKIKERKTELENRWKSDILEEFDREEREKITKEITLEVEKKLYEEVMQFINQS